MKTFLSLFSRPAVLASSLVIAVASTAEGAIIAQWTFETSPPADLNNSTSIDGIGADTGSGTASGLHASSASDWTTPAGNGSANSLSVNNWGVGDYFQFQTSSAGQIGIQLEWDQRGSDTGPRDFVLQYSTDGASFTQFGGTYTVQNVAWNSSTPTGSTHYTQDLSSVTDLDDATAIYFRLVNSSTVSIAGATVAGTGTGVIDNFSISSLTAVPEPHEYALVVGFGLAAFAVWRRMNTMRRSVA